MEGYSGLFLGTLVAATLVPISSEAMLASLYALGEYDATLLWLAASSGNTLGSVVNWGLGRSFLHFRDRGWFPVKEAALARATRWFGRWGTWSLLFSWLPFVGDPLTLVAGALRVPLGLFVVLVAIGKSGRYALLLAAAEGLR